MADSVPGDNCALRDIRGSSFAWFEKALFDKGLTWKGLLVYMGLLLYVNNKTGECFPSIATLSKRLGISKHPVLDGLKELEMKAVIAVERRVAGPSTYSLLSIDGVVTNSDTPLSPIVTVAVTDSDTNKKKEQEEVEQDGTPLFSEGEVPEKIDPKNRRMSAVTRLFALYVQVCERGPGYSLTNARLAKGMQRFDECLRKAVPGGVMVCDEHWQIAGTMFRDAILELSYSDWHMGRDPKTEGRKYNDWIDNLCKSAEQFEKWVAKAQEG